MIFICQDGKLVKGWNFITNLKMVTIAISFDGLTFLNVNGDILIFSPDLTLAPIKFICSLFILV